MRINDLSTTQQHDLNTVKHAASQSMMQVKLQVATHCSLLGLDYGDYHDFVDPSLVIRNQAQYKALTREPMAVKLGSIDKKWPNHPIVERQDILEVNSVAT